MAGHIPSKWKNYKPAWMNLNRRRSFPAIYEAEHLYGKENVTFYAPDYVEKGYCKWCGKKIENKRRKSFCCDEHARKFANATVWYRGRDAYSTRILYRDNFTCQRCGEFHADRSEFGIPIPVSDGTLEVHHIIRVSDGGDDSPQNLMTLCHDCHVAVHREMFQEEVRKAKEGETEVQNEET